ncbi:MAG: hypothetical protein A7315_05555 [Candidatus Altiarchaeales archaeon WOR_SM1_79]|nr:MAG: hypothetical protein A7315_05555 [Candidatus Altiarchaeales archaeon WOR_SM1_79]
MRFGSKKEYLNTLRTINKIVDCMRKELVLMFIMLLIINLLPSVNARDDSVKVLLFVGEKGKNDYEIGEGVPVEVRVFDMGQPRDADRPPKVILNRYDTNEREIALDKIDTGVYYGGFVILENDTDEDSFIYITTEATIGKENETDYLYDYDRDYETITVGSEEENDGDLNVRIEFEVTNAPIIEAEPGDSVDVTMIVEFDEVKIAPDNYEFTVEGEDLYPSNPSKGIYKASYEVDFTITESTNIIIHSEAEYKDKTDSAVGIIVVDFYKIWYHRVRITESNVQFEICVSDMNGKAVVGASVEFDYFTDSDDTGSESEVTDGSGKAQFSLNYESASHLQIEGSAELLGKTQNFYGYFDIEEEETETIIDEPSPYYDFQVIYQENEGTIQPDDPVALNYIAYSKAIPLQEQRIYYYIHSEEEFIKAGSVTSSSAGKFTITFRTPTYFDNIILDFETPMGEPYSQYSCDCNDGFIYEEYTDILYKDTGVLTNIDKNIELRSSVFTIGGKTKISAEIPNSGNYFAFAFVVAGEFSLDEPEEEFNPEWMPLSSLEQYCFLYPTNGKFEGELVIPEFLPEDETYTVLVFIVNLKDSSDYHLTYAHVKPGERIESGDESEIFFLQSPINIAGFGIPWIAIILIIAIILTVMVVKIKRRVIKPTEFENVDQEPYPGGYFNESDILLDNYQESGEYPYPQPYFRRIRIYKKNSANLDGYSESASLKSPKQTAKKPYSQYPVIFPSEPIESESYSAQETYPEESTREGAFFRKDEIFEARCSSCANKFYIQGKSPPFITKCPHCNEDNYVEE